MVTQHIVLDMTPGTKPIVNVSQYDTGARTLVFHLRQNRQTFTPPEGCTAIIHGIKPDSTYFSYAAEIDGDTVVADCTEQMTACVGFAECEVRLSNSEGHVGSANFLLNCEKSPMTGAIISDTDIPVFEQLATRAETAAATATEAAQESTESAEAAAGSASAAAISEENAAASAEVAAESASDAAISAEQAGASATSAGEYADRAARESEQAIAAAERAEASEASVSDSAARAAASATQAGIYAGNASESAEEASAASETASAKAQAASNAATAAAGSATTAQTAAATATTKAGEASGSATAAATSASGAASSASAASTFADTASTKAGEAAGFASDAAASATAANTSATNAGESASAAAESASNAADSAAEAVAAVASLAPLRIIESTEPADITSISDGAEDIPMQSLKVCIEPVQDLHGYDSPWPPGGGKNKANADSSGMLSTSDGYTVLTNRFWGHSDQFVPVSGSKLATRATRTLALTIYFYDSDKQFLSIIQPIRNSKTSVITLPSNVAFIRFGLNIHGTEEDFSTDLLSTYQIQAEFSDAVTDYAPYSNICPISGWDSVETVRTGKNLLDMDSVLTDAWINTTAGNIASISGANIFYADVPKNTTLTYSADNGNRCVIVGYIKRPDILSGAAYDTLIFNYGGQRLSQTFDTGDCEFVALYLNRDQASKPTWVQLELGSTATAYEPYEAQTITTALPSTVYGGTLDVVTGELVVDRELKTLAQSDSFSFLTGDGFFQFTYFPDQAIYAKGGSVNSICNRFPKITLSDRGAVSGLVSYDGDSGYRFALKASMGIATVEQWKAYYAENPVSFTLYYTTPITYTLTPQDVKTLLEVNNIFADAGQTAIVYMADTKAYIDKKIAEVQALVLNG